MWMKKENGSVISNECFETLSKARRGKKCNNKPEDRMCFFSISFNRSYQNIKSLNIY